MEQTLELPGLREHYFRIVCENACGVVEDPIWLKATRKKLLRNIRYLRSAGKTILTVHKEEDDGWMVPVEWPEVWQEEDPDDGETV